MCAMFFILSNCDCIRRVDVNCVYWKLHVLKKWQMSMKQMLTSRCKNSICNIPSGIWTIVRHSYQNQQQLYRQQTHQPKNKKRKKKQSMAHKTVIILISCRSLNILSLIFIIIYLSTKTFIFRSHMLPSLYLITTHIRLIYRCA